MRVEHTDSKSRKSSGVAIGVYGGLGCDALPGDICLVYISRRCVIWIIGPCVDVIPFCRCPHARRTHA